MKELLHRGESEDKAGSEEGERSEGGDDSLFKLVRETSAKKKKKRKVNFIVTLAGAGHDFVPSRWSSLMLTDRGDKEKYVPQRPSPLGDNQPAASAKRERSVSTEDFEVDQGKSPPAEEAIAVTTTEGAKPRQKRESQKRKSRKYARFRKRRHQHPLIGESLIPLSLIGDCLPPLPVIRRRLRRYMTPVHLLTKLYDLHGEL